MTALTSETKFSEKAYIFSFNTDYKNYFTFDR